MTAGFCREFLRRGREFILCLVFFLWGILCSCGTGIIEMEDGGELKGAEDSGVEDQVTVQDEAPVAADESTSVDENSGIDGSVDPLEQWVQDTLNSMSLSQRIGQLLLIRYTSDCDLIGNLQVGGVVYFGEDITREGKLRTDNVALQQCAQGKGLAVPLVSSTNHEGGRVYYFDAGSQVTHFASAMLQCQKGTPYVYDVSLAQAEELFYTGINVTLGPTADVLLNPQNTVIGDRAYSTTPGATADCVENALKGYHDGSVLALVKHFPGHGATSADTHQGVAIDNASLADLEANYLLPFWRALDRSDPAEFVMVSHVWYPNLDPSWPAGLSPTIMDLVKSNPAHPFQGAAMTDELTMGAIANYWGLDRAAVLALMAGNDLMMMADYSAATSFLEQMFVAWDNGWSATVNDLAGNPQNISYTKEQIQERITDAVRRILRVKRLSKLDSFAIIQDIQNRPEPDWATHHALANQVQTFWSTELKSTDDSLSPCLTGVGTGSLR